MMWSRLAPGQILGILLLKRLIAYTQGLYSRPLVQRVIFRSERERLRDQGREGEWVTLGTYISS